MCNVVGDLHLNSNPAPCMDSQPPVSILCMSIGCKGVMGMCQVKEITVDRVMLVLIRKYYSISLSRSLIKAPLSRRQPSCAILGYNYSLMKSLSSMAQLVMMMCKTWACKTGNCQ